MQFRLLIDLTVFDFLLTLSPPRRRRFVAHFHKLQDFPGHYSDYIHHYDIGRRLDVSIFDGLAIYYWTDAADQHVKILKITRADE